MTDFVVDGVVIVASGGSGLAGVLGKFVESLILYVVVANWWSTGFVLDVVFELRLLLCLVLPLYFVWIGIVSGVWEVGCASY